MYQLETRFARIIEKVLIFFFCFFCPFWYPIIFCWLLQERNLSARSLFMHVGVLVKRIRQETSKRLVKAVLYSVM